MQTFTQSLIAPQIEEYLPHINSGFEVEYSNEVMLSLFLTPNKYK